MSLIFNPDFGPTAVSSLTELAALNPPGGIVAVLGSAPTANRYYWDKTSTATANGTTVVAANDFTQGRWLLIVDSYGARFAEAYGVSTSNSAAANTTALQTAIDAGGLVTLTTPGTYQVTSIPNGNIGTSLELGPGVYLTDGTTIWGAGYFAASTPLANSVVCLGDSIMSHNQTVDSDQNTFDTYGFWTYANSLLGGRLKLLNNAATAGHTTAQMLARLSSDVMSYRPAMCWILGGINDVLTGVTPATTIANLQEICRKCSEVGITPVYFSTPPTQNTSSGVDSAAEYWALHEITQAMLDYCIETPGVLYVPAWEALVDTTGSRTEAPQYFSDYLHPGPRANYRIGSLAAEVLDPVVRKFRFSRGIDLFSTFTGLLQNPGLSGTAGTVSGGTGVVADGWSVQLSGSPTVVWSKAARNDSRFSTLVPQNRNGEFQICQMTPVAANNRAWLQQTVTAIANHASTLWSSGGTAVLNRRYRPTNANGYHYICTVGGTFSSGADPTASWSQQIGTTFTNGTATLRVVEAIAPGDTVYMTGEVVIWGWNSKGNIEATVTVLDSGAATILQASDGFWDTVRPLDRLRAGYYVMRTPEIVLPAAAMQVRCDLKTWGAAPESGNFTVDISTPAAATFTKASHDLLPGQKLQLTTTGSLPTGLATGTDYYVLLEGMTANTFRLATADGGTAIVTSGSQSGTHSIAEQSGGFVGFANWQIHKVT